MNAHFRIDLSQLQPQLNFGWYSPQLINGCQIYSIYHKFQFVPLYFQKKQSITFIFLYQDSSYLIQQQIQMRNLHLAIAVFVLIFIQQAESTNKLIFVQQLFRHGARYPIYPKRGVDMTDYVLDEKKMGQLTTQGKNMHYLLGKQVYKAYWNQLFTDPIYSQTFNNTKFYFKSTDVNRTFESCQSHLMGIFQNLPKLTITNEQTNFSKPLWPGTSAVAGDVFPNAPLFHPVPIHSQKLGTSFNDKGDFLRSYSPQNCPQQNVWVKQNQASTFAKMVASDQSFVKTLAQLTKALNRTQKNPVTFEQEGYFYDNYECSTFLGKPTLPIFSDPKYARDLAYIYTIDLYINLFFSDTQIRTTSSGFFQATLANINRAISKRDVQWVIYSAHDTTVGNILAGLNMTNAACIYEAYKKGEEYNKDTCVSAYPGYTANIIFEVYEDNETLIQTFKIRYNGEYRKIPFCDNALECRVEKMQKWYNENIKVQSFAANCGLINEDKVFYKGFAIIEFGVILCFCLYWVIRHLKQTVVLVKPADKKQAEAEIKMLKKELLKEQV